MLFKFLIALSLLASLNAMALEQAVEVMVKKSEIAVSAPKAQVTDLFTINGIRQAVTKELILKKLDNDEFWKKVEEKNLSDAAEINFFAPAFTTKQVHVNEASIDTGRPLKIDKPAETELPTIDPFLRGSFTYDLDSEKLKKVYDEVMSLVSLPDLGIKTFYILADIRIDSDMSWEDVGVTKKENFSGVIIDSWKKWVTTSFKNFENVVVLEKDFNEKPENINPESVTLKWNSSLKRAEVFQDRKSARFEMTAQYVLVNTKSGESLSAFDFPNQKREYNISNPKQLSSNLASLTYNLLSSQIVKITSALETNRASSIVEIKITGKAGLLDISELNSMLAERFKQIALTSETKSYSSDSSVISIKSTAGKESLYALFAKDGGKFPLNEQKILVFNQEDHSFAIISKEANN